MFSSHKQKYQAYAAATQTIAKTKQIVVLYDGAIRFLQQAKETLPEKRIEERYHLLMKASDVISGLQSCLDFERGGEIAKLLYGFYASIESRIFSIHRTGSAQTCDQLIAELRQMRDAWHEIDQGDATVNAVVSADAAVEPAIAVAGQSSPPANVAISA